MDKIPTNEVHLYDFEEDSWTSTYSLTGSGSNKLKKFRIARANHACAKYEEEGRVKVIIAGGVTMEAGRFKTTNTSEILDFDSFTWVFGHHLRGPLTGGKFIDVEGRPTLVGRFALSLSDIWCECCMSRYGDHRQRSMMRYDPKKFWTELPIKLAYGRSDFQAVADLPATLSAEMMTFSRMTKINPGPPGCEVNRGEWRRSLNSYLNGKKMTLVTPPQKNPWIQLNLKRPLAILAVTICFAKISSNITLDMIQVVFESGILETGKSQNVEVKFQLKINNYNYCIHYNAFNILNGHIVQGFCW